MPSKLHVAFPKPPQDQKTRGTRMPWKSQVSVLQRKRPLFLKLLGPATGTYAVLLMETLPLSTCNHM